MDRRMFLRSALAVASAAATLSVLGQGEAKAESLMETLKRDPRGDMQPDLPAAEAQEAQYGYGWRRRHWGWRRRGWGGGRRCWWRRNRWGNLVRVCRW
jgi:hypothetical protein